MMFELKGHIIERKIFFKNCVLMLTNLGIIFEVRKYEFRVKVQGERDARRQSLNINSPANS